MSITEIKINLQMNNILLDWKSEPGKSIPVGDTKGHFIAYLKAATPSLSKNRHLMEQTSSWRNQYLEELMSDQPATPESTENYFREYLPAHARRIQFFLFLNDGTAVGHIAAEIHEPGCVELINGILGLRMGPKKLFEYAERSLVTWCFNQLGAHTVFLKVRNDNIPARWLHSRVGLKLDEGLKTTLKVMEPHILLMSTHRDNWLT